MARFRYFADVDGVSFELSGVYFEGGKCAVKPEHFIGRLPSGTTVRATRRIEFKANASLHKCDARCLHATGRSMKCECSCGGKNHGKGSIAA